MPYMKKRRENKVLLTRNQTLKNLMKQTTVFEIEAIKNYSVNNG